jgi:hypothetical protein
MALIEMKDRREGESADGIVRELYKHLPNGEEGAKSMSLIAATDGRVALVQESDLKDLQHVWETQMQVARREVEAKFHKEGQQRRAPRLIFFDRGADGNGVKSILAEKSASACASSSSSSSSSQGRDAWKPDVGMHSADSNSKGKGKPAAWRHGCGKAKGSTKGSSSKDKYAKTESSTASSEATVDASPGETPRNASSAAAEDAIDSSQTNSKHESELGAWCDLPAYLPGLMP